MMDKLKELFGKYYDVVIYLVFGVLTTVVNYIIYLPLYNFTGLSAAVSNAVAWVGAVIFAFVTNKPLVFRSYSWKKEVVVPEFVKFVGCRVGSGALETLIIFLAVDTMGWNGNLWKLITSVLVVVLNYIGSKLLVFKQK